MKRLNKEIELKFIENGIDIDEGFLFLLAIYYDLEYTSLVAYTRAQITTLKMVDLNLDTKKLELKMNLFEDESVDDYSDYDFIIPIRSKFKSINPERNGPLKEVKVRIASFMRENKSVTKEEIIGACEYYLESIDDPQYLKSLNYFIKHKKDSRLLYWVELFREQKDLNDRNLNNTTLFT